MDEQNRLVAELEKREKWILSVKKKFAEQRERREKLKEQECCAELAELEFVQRWRSWSSTSRAGSSFVEFVVI